MNQDNDYKTLERKFGTILLDADVYYRVYGTEKPRPYHLFKKISGFYLNSKKRKGVYCRFAKRRKSVSLSRLIINARKGEIVDHIERNTLDNRRCKLRLVNSRQNNINRSCRNNTGFFGVSSCKNNNGKCYARVHYKVASGKACTFCAPDNPHNRIICAFAHDKFVLQAGDEEYAPLNFPCFKNEPFKSILLKENFNEYKKRQHRHI